ncbi:UNVERIFIED_CONTAM: hypothetical protein Sradi_4398300 [Sesamum radiatum]|uniref:Uncharacterized protein n=1 Tax=Sesamum radiatum TaxID=300843 RepID=A0AAW2NRV1_SESRA
MLRPGQDDVLGVKSPEVVYIPGFAWVRGLFVKDVCLGAGLAFCRSYPLEEVLWRGSSVSGSTGLGGPRTTVPLAGTRDIPGTTCRV